MCGQASASVTVERLRLQPDPLPPQQQPVLCPVAVAAATRGLSPAIPANIFISVSLASQGQPSPPVSAAAAAAELHDAYHEPHHGERCYPDLLDIGLSSFATLPRRSLRRAGELGSPYDNMGPRVTATGSSTFSLVEQPEPTTTTATVSAASPPPPPPSPPLGVQIAAAAPLIQPPPEFVSL